MHLNDVGLPYVIFGNQFKDVNQFSNWDKRFCCHYSDIQKSEFRLGAVFWQLF